MRADAPVTAATLYERGYLEPLDYYFARSIAQLAGCADESVMLAAALASRSSRMGHVCLDLNEIGGSQLDTLAEVPAVYPQPDVWRSLLENSGCVGAPGDIRPLILDGHGRLYLYRMYRREQQAAAHIIARSGRTIMADAEALAHSFARLFPPQADVRLRLAAFSAAVKPLCVICGGPGTGKTTTAARILALLLEQPGQGRRLALAAPTGKAAERLQRAIAGTLPGLNTAPEIREAIAGEAVTLHRLLGLHPRRPDGRYTQGRTLPADIVVVDEASMVDLPLMACLLEALAPDARLLLLGDYNQLASVAPGSVLGDVYRAGSCERYSAEFLRGFAAAGQRLPDEAAVQQGAGALVDCLNELTINYRFSSESGIARLSRSVTSGDADAALALLDPAGGDDIGWSALPAAGSLAAALHAGVVTGFREYLYCTDPLEALALFERFRIMCALREGPFGVQALNALVEAALVAEGLIAKTGPWYHGRPIMITRNNYQLRLNNGDIGIAFAREKGEALRVCFADAAHGLREFSPDQLSACETAYAITVHKAQGAEFDRALLLLPDRMSPLLTRELVYTGLTRVRTRIDVWADPAVLRAAIISRIERSSGLFDALS
ncbi:MAG: exodeoxyribonuclease V subunit alpha [Deltaproteobacteria bacterium]|nr:exodeoxyribonuclease V subunit alpha [Deltaproteobacteria bacterium]